MEDPTIAKDPEPIMHKCFIDENLYPEDEMYKDSAPVEVRYIHVQNLGKYLHWLMFRENLLFCEAIDTLKEMSHAIH